APNEHVERWRPRDAQEKAGPIHDQLERFSSTSTSKLADARPDIPIELDDRAAEVWEPLLAIADMAGDDWPERARAAALALSVGEGREDDSLGVRLLKDVQELFGDEEAMFTRDIVQKLTDMDTA